jgi:ATP-dependent DNA helicase RecG
VLVTASHPLARAQSTAKDDLTAGRPVVLVGTQALLAPSLEIPRLAFVVVDELHRFGVQQRAGLYAKGRRPDLLVMSATPIPRSLALSAFGDLEISTLDELPANREPITTARVSVKRRFQVAERLVAALERGERVFVVVPHIEAGEAGVPSLAVEGRWWSQALAEHEVRVVHGRLEPAAQRLALEEFRTGLARVLVATSVVEVGLDVPEATWMVVDGAEHFGLAQLHQLRGRVGRGSVAGRCVVIHGALNQAARARLEAFVTSSDGFALSQLDLEQRGPGEFLGVRQSGSTRLRWVDPLADPSLLEAAREDARLLLRVPEARRYLELARHGRLSDPGWFTATFDPAADPAGPR